MVSNKVARKALLYCAGSVVMLAIAFVMIVPDARVTVVRMILPGACMTEQTALIPNLSGMKFEVVYTNCDTLAKEEATSVYISRASVNGESLFARWSNRKTLVFRYDPARWDSPPPSIKALRNDRVLISIPEVSSVILQSRRWRKVSIDYNIEHIDYP